jgi:hypothetical protein
MPRTQKSGDGMGIPDCSELQMDTSKILFDPTVFFKTRLDEKPFLKALAVWRSESNRQSPKEIEESHALPRNSFLAYVKHAFVHVFRCFRSWIHLRNYFLEQQKDQLLAVWNGHIYY